MSQIKDFLWYSQHVLKIQTKVHGLKPLRLMHYQKRYIDHLRSDFKEGIVRSIVLKARQCGFSTLVAGINTHRLVTEFDYKVMVLADKSSRTDDVVNIYRRFIAHIPDRIKPMIAKDNEREVEFDNPNAQKRITSPGLGSSLKAETALDPYVGRSGTRKSAHLTEAAFYRYSAEIDEGIGNSIPLARGTYIVRESTANGRSGIGESFYNLWTAASMGESIYKPFFVPWYQVDDYALPVVDGFKPTKYELDLVKVCPEITPQNLVWRRMKLLEYATNVSIFTPEERFMQDFPSFPEQAFRYSGIPVFDQEKLKSMINRLRETPAPVKKVRFERPYLAMFAPMLTVYEVPKTGVKYTIGCLPDGELVYTDKGLIPIEEVSLKNKLLDADGKLTGIKNIQRRPYSGKLVKIKPYGSISPVAFTEEHPIMVLKNNKLKRETSGDKKRYYEKEVVWKKAGEISEDDILRFPIIKKEMSKEAILSKLNQRDIRIDKKINPNVILDKEFWYLVGAWLAEGYLSKSGLTCLSYNLKKDSRQVERIREIVTKLFGRSLLERKRAERSTHEIMFQSKMFANFIRDHLGQKALNKSFPFWVNYLPRELKLTLFEGYFDGDGAVVSTKSGDKIMCNSISRKLTTDFRHLLLTCGVVSSTRIERESGTGSIKGKVFKQKTLYGITVPSRDTHNLLTELGRRSDSEFSRDRHKGYQWIEDGYLYTKIHKVEHSEINAFVNNFETESHSYCAEYIATHNCDVAEGLEEGDASAACVLDENLNQVAKFYGKLDPDLLGKCAVELATVYNKALIVPEINNMGYATLTAIKNEGYLRIYQRSQYEYIEEEKETDKLGWRTTAQSKMLMISTLVSNIRENNIKINDLSLLIELESLTRESNGDVELNGKDRTVACCLACMGINQLYEGAIVLDPDKKERVQFETKDLYREKEHKRWASK